MMKPLTFIFLFVFGCSIYGQITLEQLAPKDSIRFNRFIQQKSLYSKSLSANDFIDSRMPFKTNNPYPVHTMPIYEPKTKHSMPAFSPDSTHIHYLKVYPEQER